MRHKNTIFRLITLAVILRISDVNGLWPPTFSTNQEEMLRETLQCHFPFDEIKEASELQGLSTSKLFRIKLSNQDLVLRLLNPQRSNDLYNSISQEVECMKKMADQKVAPYLY